MPADNENDGMKGGYLVYAKTIRKAAESVVHTAHDGEMLLTSGKRVEMQGQQGGVRFMNYVPAPPQTHPDIIEVQFLDKDNKVIVQQALPDFGGIKASDHLYGEKVKIKILTKNVTDGTKLQAGLKVTAKNKDIPKAEIEALQWSLEVKGNTAETPFFTLKTVWFDESAETYSTSTFETSVKPADLIEFFVAGTLNAKPFVLPEADKRLKPVSYLRNYEELIGLYSTAKPKKAAASLPKSLRTNYENRYILQATSTESLVRGFTNFLTDAPDLTADKIKAKAEEAATALWKAGVALVQGGALDDRPMYWARAKMQVRLKQHPAFRKDIDYKTSTVKKGTGLEKIIMAFEEKSRNYRGINFGAAGIKKKLLITGFDPFVLNPETSGNPLQSNPSGINALALHGKTVGGFYIQTCIMPVRYADFDDFIGGEGVVESVVKPHIGTVDMIVTVSQGGAFRFDVDRFGAKHRGGYGDNMNWGSGTGNDSSLFKQLPTGDEFYETTLPYDQMVPDKNAPKDTFFVYFNQTYNPNNGGDNNDQIEGKVLRAKFADVAKETSVEGSGGDYLSNEIFYRVAQMRAALRPTLRTGHLHIPLTQYRGGGAAPRGNKITEDINPKIGALLQKIRSILAAIKP